MLKKPSKEQEECQQPKPVLLNTGEITVPYEWQPSIIDVQLVRIGNFFIAAVPSEMTTMSGRRLRKAIKKVLIEQGVGNNDTIVIQTLANGYAASIHEAMIKVVLCLTILFLIFYCPDLVLLCHL